MEKADLKKFAPTQGAIYINDHIIKTRQFAGGERNVNVSDIAIDNGADITAYLYTTGDVFDLLLTIDALRRINKDIKIDLTIPYLPGARQDRVCNPGEALTVEVMAGLINNLACNSVTVFDPHSAKTMECLKNAWAITAAEIVSSSTLKDFIRDKNLELVAPDEGATKRTKQAADALELPIHYCRKKRDPATQKITDTIIPEGVTGKDLIIIDDICDGGRTFIELGQKLKTAGAKSVYLYVTHGIFMAGLEILKPAIDGVFCLHTYLPPEQRDPSYLRILEEEMDARPLTRFRHKTSSPTLAA
jgi:ribose-phosphate pyrophosphokinase